MRDLIRVTFLLASLYAAPVLADVSVGIRTSTASSTNRPSDFADTVTVTAVLDHLFSTKVVTTGHTVEASGTVHQSGHDRYQAHVKFVDQGQGCRSAETTVTDMKPGQPSTIAGVGGSTIEVTITPQP